MYLSTLLIYLLAVAFARGQVRNVTIDDAMGDEDLGVLPQYGGMPAWRARKSGDTCSMCSMHPAANRMVDRTWHDATTKAGQEPAEITFTFKGTNLFIFCTLAGLKKGSFTQTHLTLTIDGATTDTFDWIPDSSSPDFRYRQPVLAAKGLENGNHTVKVSSHAAIVNGRAVGSLILFDFALYNTDTTLASDDAASLTTGPSSSSTPTVHNAGNSKLVLPLGIVCSVVGLVLLVGSLVIFLRFRRRRQAQSYERLGDRVHAHSPLTQLPAPPAEARLVRGSEPLTRTPNLGLPVDYSRSNRQLNIQANLINDRNRRLDSHHTPPPSYA